MSKYAIPITPRTFDLVVFLNDGVSPVTHIQGGFSPKDYLVCEINGPREITTKVWKYDELYGENGALKVNGVTVIN
jgi:hypothetical protein